MTKPITQVDSRQIAYESNPYKKLVLVASTNNCIDEIIATHAIADQTLDQQVLNQIHRTRHLASYKDTTYRTASTPSIDDFDLDGLKSWIDHIFKVDGRLRAIAFSAKDPETLQKVFWKHAPLNDTGGIFGHDTRKAISDYKFPEKKPANVAITEGAFRTLLYEVYSIPEASTVRWTDSILACQIVNTMINLSNDNKLLDINDLLVKL